jgi:hypothetical protein
MILPKIKYKTELQYNTIDTGLASQKQLCIVDRNIQVISLLNDIYSHIFRDII